MAQTWSATPAATAGVVPSVKRVARELSGRGWSLEAVMTDNASEFRSAEFERAVAALKARHIFIRAGRPQTNGCVERVQGTILDECWKPAFARYLTTGPRRPSPSSHGRAGALLPPHGRGREL